MFLGAIGIAGCMALIIISLAGVAGLRDEWRAVGTQAASTTVAEVATQYQLANQDLAAGNVELSLIRLQDVTTKMPDYQNAANLLPTVQAMASFTPTASPSASPTLPAPTLTPTVAAVQSASPSDDPAANTLDPAELFGRAETAYTVGLYEEAIEWYDTLALVDPSYRRDEVQTKRLDAMIRLGTSYLRGTNSDGQDRLSQGIQLIWRADELGDVPGEVLYEADFVARYLSARGLVEGGANAQALDVLTRLCEEDCDWSYGGVSVRALLSQAGGVPN
jgi:tetratricopeptide (TPR) repeat protein